MAKLEMQRGKVKKKILPLVMAIGNKIMDKLEFNVNRLNK